MERTKLESFVALSAQLEQERSTYRGLWKDLSNFILPRRSRFFVGDINKGDRRNNFIIDPTATLAVRTLASGFMSGVTSPARQWFKTSLGGIQNDEDAKAWLSQVDEIMSDTFLKSNLYNVLPTVYSDLGVFGVGCFLMEEDADNVVNFTPFMIGSYKLSHDKKGNIKVFVRDFTMTVRQLVEKFGLCNVSETVAMLFKDQNLEQKIDVTHAIRPNSDYDKCKLLAKHKKFKSVYYETGKTSEGKFLRESGYDRFPILAPRWQTNGESSYGEDSPGFVALGDVKQLQHGEKRSLQAIDQKVNPSMTAPVSMKNTEVSMIPGEITYLDVNDPTKTIRRLFDVDFNINDLEQKQASIRNRISRTFFEDLFLMLASSDRRQITAREIDERHEEKLLALGPVLERLNQDVLEPLIENTFYFLEKQGLLPEAPESLEGKDLKIEYVSIMHQAQKIGSISHIERTVGFVQGLAQTDSAAMQKLDVNAVVNEYANVIGLKPNLLVSDEVLAEQAAQQQMMQQQAMAMEQQTNEAANMKAMSETKLGTDSALDAIAGGA